MQGAVGFDLPGTLQAFGFERLTVSTSAVGLTASKIEPVSSVLEHDAGKAKAVKITVDTDKVRYREDGTNPTSTIGHEVAVGSEVWIVGLRNIQQLRMIRSGVADAVVEVTYLR
jgi:hypothetical protein